MQKPDVVDDAWHGMWRNNKRLRLMKAWGPEASATAPRRTSRDVSALATGFVKSSRVAHPHQRSARVRVRLSVDGLGDWVTD